MSSPTTTPKQQPDAPPCSRSLAARRVTLDYGLPKYVVPFDVAEEIEHELNETRASLESHWRKSAELAGELIAMIRTNVMRDTFREATIEQVDEHLKPWIARLAALQPPSTSCPDDQGHARRD